MLQDFHLRDHPLPLIAHAASRMKPATRAKSISQNFFLSLKLADLFSECFQDRPLVNPLRSRCHIWQKSSQVLNAEPPTRYTLCMSAAPQKTFYLETFGCQMNVHDSEKVIGTLLHEGYRQGQTVEGDGVGVS